MRAAAHYKIKVLDYKKESLEGLNMKNYIHQAYMSIPREAPLFHFIVSKKRHTTSFEATTDKNCKKNNYLMVNTVNLTKINENTLNASSYSGPKQESFAPTNFYSLQHSKKKEKKVSEKPIPVQERTISKHATKHTRKKNIRLNPIVYLKNLDEKTITFIKKNLINLNEIIYLD